MEAVNSKRREMSEGGPALTRESTRQAAGWASFGLFVLPLIVSLGPRFEFVPGLPEAHLRVQDFLIPPVFAICYVLFVSNRRRNTPILRATALLVALLFAATGAAIMFEHEGRELLIRLGFLFRLSLLPMIAFVVFLGLPHEGRRGLLFLASGFSIGVFANLAGVTGSFLSESISKPGGSPQRTRGIGESLPSVRAPLSQRRNSS